VFPASSIDLPCSCTGPTHAAALQQAQSECGCLSNLPCRYLGFGAAVYGLGSGASLCSCSLRVLVLAGCTSCLYLSAKSCVSFKSPVPSTHTPIQGNLADDGSP
jgi:hypothetical protein